MHRSVEMFATATASGTNGAAQDTVHCPQCAMHNLVLNKQENGLSDNYIIFNKQENGLLSENYIIF